MSEQKDEVYYNTLDKRTKEYKEWETKKTLKGMGDVIEKALKKTGISRIAKFILGDDCGCDERRDVINKLFPFKNVECLKEDEYSFLHLWFSKARFRITHEEQTQMLEIHNRVFHRKNTITQCTKCIKTKVQELNLLYLEYNPKENESDNI